MILVVGATGLLGARICERLRAEGCSVRALVRRTSSPDKVNALRALGCELATGDLKDPPQIKAACQGISALISTASSTLSRQAGDSIESVDLQGQLALVNAARSSGVGRFVYVSFRDDPTEIWRLDRMFSGYLRQEPKSINRLYLCAPHVTDCVSRRSGRHIRSKSGA